MRKKYLLLSHKIEARSNMLFLKKVSEMLDKNHSRLLINFLKIRHKKKNSEDNECYRTMVQ